MEKIFNDDVLNHIQSEASVYDEDRINTLLKFLSLAPKYTTFRVNTQCHSSVSLVDVIRGILEQQKKKYSFKGNTPFVGIHPLLDELVIIGPWDNSNIITKNSKEVIVDVTCAMAVLRGAHIFAPGIMGMVRDVQYGDEVSVYADIDRKCLRGFADVYCGNKIFIGNGIVRRNRDDLFGETSVERGVAIEMIMTLSRCPALPAGCIQPNVALLQNLPSVLCVKVLNPQPGENVLDMCAAPGNKTSHIATLMKNQGIVIALDRAPSKKTRMIEQCKQFSLSNVQFYIFNSILAVRDGQCNQTTDIKEPPYPPETFDRILLDAPCSCLGQRPQISNKITLQQIKSYPCLQRKLFKTAVALLKPGGFLMYSTCTITIEENEGIVKWALTRFPNLKLETPKINIGGPGIVCRGLTEQQCSKMKRFGHQVNNKLCIDSMDYNHDTVGFFFTLFCKEKLR